MDAYLKNALKEYDPGRAARHLLEITRKDPGIVSTLRKWRGMTGNQYKYASPENWLPKYARMARITRLDRLAPTRVLDIGAGAGWFSWVAKNLGHDATGLDLPERFPVYSEICASLGVEVIGHRIAPHTPLPPMGRFGVAIALMASFHIFRHEWDQKAFDFFLTDLESRMEGTHIILFELNHSAGQFYSRAVYDTFIGHNYRIIDNFCVRMSGLPSHDADFIFNELARYHRLRTDSYAPLWSYSVKSIIAGHASYYIDKLRNDFPNDNHLMAQKALTHALKREWEEAARLLEDAIGCGSPGYFVALSQLYSLLGDRTGAIGAIRRILKADPGNAPARERLALLSLPEDSHLQDVSDFWNSAHSIIASSSLFKQMLKESGELSSQSEPVAWYLKYGSMGLGLNTAFAPAVYLGINNDVFRAGADPLLHYLTSGIRTGRKIF